MIDLPPYSCCATATNHDERASFVDFPARGGISWSRPSMHATPAVTGSPIRVQLPAPTRPPGLVGAGTGSPARTSQLPTHRPRVRPPPVFGAASVGRFL